MSTIGPDVCVMCGEDIAQPETGRPRETCSGTCRKRRARMGVVPQRPGRQISYIDARELVTQLPGPWLLDLFCGAGGAAAGYYRAGWNVIGVDNKPQPRYPYAFIEYDAFDFLRRGGYCGFDLIHASPPCQRYSVMCRSLGTADDHPDLIEPTRRALQRTGVPYVIENVPGAPLVNPVKLCGSSFGLDLRRHRLFESSLPLLAVPCQHSWQTPRFTPASNRTNLARVVNIYGACSDVELWRRTFETHWMSRDEISQAIPPAYTEFIGRQLLEQVSTTLQSTHAR